MKLIFQNISNFILFCILNLFLLGFQTTFWKQVFNSESAPQLWIPVLVYWALYRPFHLGLLMCYVLSVMLISFSASGLGTQLLVLSLLFGLIQAFRSRIYYTGALFYMAVSGASTLAYPILHFVVSNMIESNPMYSVPILTWLMCVLLTMLFALLLFPIGVAIDRWTGQQHINEITGDIV